jgi:hypothetical protein
MLLQQKSRWDQLGNTLLPAIRQPVPFNNLVFSQCGQENAFFSPSTRDITICYEEINQLLHTGANQQGKALNMVGGILFILFHEYGHALINDSSIPVLGGDENAADQIAAVLIKKKGIRDAVLSAALGGVLKPQPFVFAGKRALADEHGLSQQRRANLICWAAADSKLWMDAAISHNDLTPHRAARCSEEAAKAERTVNSLLEAHSPVSLKKEHWVARIASINGCNGNIFVFLKNTDGNKENYEAQCPNKTLEVTCEFMGEVYEGEQGLPYIKISGKAFQAQPACWL